MRLFSRKKKEDSSKQNEDGDTSFTGLPEHVEYPGSADRPWNEIPIGVVEGKNGLEEYALNVSISPHIFISGSTGSGKSTVQRSIINHCLQHSEDWRFLGIDLSRVEFSPYAQYEPAVLAIASDVSESVNVLRYAKDEMMERYKKMETNGVSHFKGLPQHMNALMIMIDGAYNLLMPSGIKTEEGREEDALKAEATQLIGDIARLGRFTGIHLAISTSRIDKRLLPPLALSCITSRVVLGKTDSIASMLALGNENGTLTKSQRGAGYVQVGNEGQKFQSYFSTPTWVENYTSKTS